ncbi:MAG TPA: amidohydrolase family protein [Stellaceae bacterium]|nr:amidohydrolase family protein [Stellaceae bacterium]
MDQTSLRVNLPWDPNPRQPRFTPPPNTCDTHFHVWGPPDRFPYAESRRYTPPAAPIEHFWAMSSVIGVQRGFLLHASAHGFDNAVTLDAVARSEGRLRAVLRATDQYDAATLKKLHAQGVRGMRFNFIERLKTSAESGLFDHERLHKVAAQIAPHSWFIDLHIEPKLIVENADLLRRVPVPIVIDHFGKVNLTAGVDHPDTRAVLDLLGEPNIWIKVSGSPTRITAGGTIEQLTTMARAMIARAPDRVVWGSDWPHSDVFVPGHMPNDGDLMNMVEGFAPDEATRRKILAENPARLTDFA